MELSPPPRANFWAAMSSLSMALAIGLGAFGAHALKARLSIEMLAVYQTANWYHVVHALGGLVVATSFQQHRKVFCTFALVGTVLFSGSLYLLAVTDLRWLGMITPLGGVLFIIAWIWLAIQTFKHTSSNCT